MVIEYKGKTLKTERNLPMTDGEFARLKKEYFAKPSFENVKAEVFKVIGGGNVTMPNITNYFLKDLMAKVKISYAKWSIEEMFEFKPIIEVFNYACSQNDEVFLPEMTKLQKIMKAVDLGGAGVAKKPTNFDLGQTIEIIKKHNINGNYYDPSCGWGVRLVGSLCCGVNYFGTDPNYELVDRLNQIAKLFQEVDMFSPSCDIRSIGSEIFVPEWENKIGFIMTSPPYFFLEDYGIGEQSTKLYPQYDDWLKKYYLPTFKNCYKYAIKGASMLINIKNYAKYDLEEQTKILAKMAGWHFVGTEKFDNIQRINVNGELNDSSENIYVFKKD